MNKPSLVLGLSVFLSAAAASWADPVATSWAEPAATRNAEAPATMTGIIGQDTETEKVADILGKAGVLYIHSEARWQQVEKLLSDLGLRPDHALPTLDFSTHKIQAVLVYSAAHRPGDTFSLTKLDLTANVPSLDFMLRWNNGPEEKEEQRSTKFILAVMDFSKVDREFEYAQYLPKVQVTLKSQPTSVDRARVTTEFAATLGDKDGGDVVDGLQAKLTAKDAKIAPGGDILLDFELHLATAALAKAEHFGAKPATAGVWDGKYSNGYRNHGFIVTSPDGKTTFLQPKVQGAWDKNAPHVVNVTADKPYHLPNWAQGSSFKSLKELGLDTTMPGTYVITGIYEEKGDHTPRPSADGEAKQVWAGSIESNTVAVNVAALN